MLLYLRLAQEQWLQVTDYPPARSLAGENPAFRSSVTACQVYGLPTTASVYISISLPLTQKVVGGVALCRRLCCKSVVNYTAVNHSLDEEEIAFKNSLEAQNEGGDDIDELFNFSGQDELEFDTNDLDNLEMLQVSI